MSTNTSATSALSQAQATTSTDGTTLSSLQPSSTSSPISSADNSSIPSPASSSPATTNNAVTSTTPATSASPTTTPQSSSAQTASAAVTTTSAAPASSTSTTSTVAPITSSPSTFTTQVATTLPSTDAAGSVVYVTTTVPNVVTTSIGSSTSSSSSGSSSHTTVIVGAVVGGVAGIALLALLLFCIRRRARKDEFDGNFDPDHIVGQTDGGGGTLPHVDLADEVTPFPQYTDQGSSSMRQHSESPYVAIPSSLTPSGKASTDFYPSGAGAAVDAQPRQFMQPGAGPAPSGAYLPPINMYGTGPVDWHTPRPGVSPPPSTVSHNTTSTRATKEREALGRSGQGVGLGLATQQEAAEGSGDVVVHQDAGRAPAEEHAPPREIPPAYESIRQD